MTSAYDYSEGNLVNAVSFFMLIAAGVLVLLRRKIDWGLLLRQNKWIWLYFLYCALSISWSDSPFVSLKRFFKDLGDPIMVLVILTEEHPYEAVGVILRRLAFLLLPLSLLFIRYYGELGKGYSPSGDVMFTGVGEQKNSLGQMCLISGIYFSWKFLLNRKQDFRWRWRGNETDLILAGMAVYLLHMSHSATSLACLVVAVSLFLMGRTRLIAQKPGGIIVWMIVAALLFVFFDVTLDASDAVIRMLGRDETLTMRTSIWEAVKSMVTNPVVGAGYQGFWVGQRMETLWKTTGPGIVQAHNGYLEQYVNLGYIGVAFIGVIMLSGLLKVRRHLSVDYPSAMLRLCFIVTAALYNYTEASFYGINNMWILLLLGVIDVPRHNDRS
jgi:O-antigen ligase